MRSWKACTATDRKPDKQFFLNNLYFLKQMCMRTVCRYVDNVNVDNVYVEDMYVDGVYV